MAFASSTGFQSIVTEKRFPAMGITRAAFSCQEAT
jgi:hypothetical protein